MRPQGVLDGRILGRVLIMGILHGNVAVGVARRLGRRHWGNGGGLRLRAWVHALLVRIILESGLRLLLLLGLDLAVVGVVSGRHGHLAGAVVVSPGRAAGGRVGVWLPLLLHGCWQGEGQLAERTWGCCLVVWFGSGLCCGGRCRRRRERGGEEEGGLKLSKRQTDSGRWLVAGHRCGPDDGGADRGLPAWVVQ